MTITDRKCSQDHLPFPGSNLMSLQINQEKYKYDTNTKYSREDGKTLPSYIFLSELGFRETG